MAMLRILHSADSCGSQPRSPASACGSTGAQVRVDDWSCHVPSLPKKDKKRLVSASAQEVGFLLVPSCMCLCS